MLNIEIGQEQICAVGHAENKPICGLFSGIGAFVMIGLELSGDSDAMHLAPGYMVVDRTKVASDAGSHLIDTLIASLYQLSDEYPNSFKLT